MEEESSILRHCAAQTSRVCGQAGTHQPALTRLRQVLFSGQSRGAASLERRVSADTEMFRVCALRRGRRQFYAAIGLGNVARIRGTEFFT